MRKGRAVTRVRTAWRPHRRGFGVGLAFVVLLSSRHAAATVDMGGHWLTGIMVVPPGELTRWNCTQIGTALSCIDTVFGTSLVPGSGTIDLDTGDFTLNPGNGFCGGPINGHVDGATRTFSATASVLSEDPRGSICWPAQIAGQRCGNGVVDSGEQCEKTYPIVTRDCCDRACQLIPAGTGCDVDRNACTLDVCDGNGTCALDTVAAAGEPCDDGNACTLTACDAAGTCAVQDTMTCGPCQSCSPLVGCFNQSGCTTTTSTTVTTTTTTSSTTTTLAPTIGIRMRGLALRDDVVPPIEPSSRRVKGRAATANDPAARAIRDSGYRPNWRSHRRPVAMPRFADAAASSTGLPRRAGARGAAGAAVVCGGRGAGVVVATVVRGFRSSTSVRSVAASGSTWTARSASRKSGWKTRTR
jgi:hypothetical protein